MAAMGAADSGRSILSEAAVRIKPGVWLFHMAWFTSDPRFCRASRLEMP